MTATTMSVESDSRLALGLIVAGRALPVPKLPVNCNCMMERAGTGALAIEVARNTLPDVILIDAKLADMNPTTLCRILRSDPAVGRKIPILFVSSDEPTAEERLAALHAGVWDSIQLPRTGDAMALTLRVYAQAQWSMAGAGSTESFDAENRIRSASELARHADRLGALMSRQRAGIACVVFEVDPDQGTLAPSTLIAQFVRKSDVVGVLGPRHVGVIAPATAHDGAAHLAIRVSKEVRSAMVGGGGSRTGHDMGARLLVGFDAVTNVRYSPVDPVGLIQRAAAATRTGTVEPGNLWLRRHREDVPVEGDREWARHGVTDFADLRRQT